MDRKIKENLKETSTWLRALYMFLFLIIYWVAEVIIGAVIFFQFLSVLITSSKNEKLLSLGQSLSTFIYQIMTYLTFNSEVRPYPIGEWPTGTPSENVTTEPAAPEADITPVEARSKDKEAEDNSDKSEDEKAS